jgi:hypothetical protein
MTSSADKLGKRTERTTVIPIPAVPNITQTRIITAGIRSRVRSSRIQIPAVVLGPDYLEMTGKNMKLFLTTIFAAIESRFVDLVNLKSWADRCIEATPQPCDWLIDLSLASSSNEALNVLRNALPEYEVMLDESYGELLLGFWYLRWANHDVAQEEFITECVDVIDAYEVQELDGNEIVDGSISASLNQSLATWAKASEDNLNRLFEMRFMAEEVAALSVS